MNSLLDSRRLPEQDPLLIQHAQDCEACRLDLETQRRVFEFMQVHPTRARRRSAPSRTTIGVAAASAAFVLLAVSFNAPDATTPPTGSTQTPDHANTNPAPRVEPDSPNLLAGLMHGDFSNLLPEQTQLTDTAWLDQVSGGVKPLANSMSSTFNVLRRTWPLAVPRDQGSETSPATGAGTG